MILCSHNPDLSRVARVMAALRDQSMPRDHWELLVIDNASTNRLCDVIDVDWHPRGRHFKEDRLGQTRARLCGIAASRGEILVFVDDDNVLDSDYLELAHWIGMKWPMLGSWSGRVEPEFEAPPPEWTRAYWDTLAIRSPGRDTWSNVIGFHEATPSGAGMCVRRRVAVYYQQKVEEDARHLALDRRGTCLMGSGDLDIAYAGCKLGLGMGVFTDLRLIHLIPRWRLTEDYISRLAEDTAYSSSILNNIYNIETSRLHSLPIVSYLYWISAVRMRSRDRRIFRARLRGRAKAARENGAGLIPLAPSGRRRVKFGPGLAAARDPAGSPGEAVDRGRPGRDAEPDMLRRALSRISPRRLKAGLRRLVGSGRGAGRPAVPVNPAFSASAGVRLLHDPEDPEPGCG